METLTPDGEVSYSIDACQLESGIYIDPSLTLLRTPYKYYAILRHLKEIWNGTIVTA